MDKIISKNRKTISESHFLIENLDDIEEPSHEEEKIAVFQSNKK